MSAYIKTENGTPELYIDGKRTTPILYALSDFPAAKSNTAQAHRNIEAFGKAGISLVCIDTCIHTGWHKATPYETESMHAEIESALEANPNAKILIRLHVNPPYWWLRDNPGECVIYRTEDGDIFGIDNGESDRLIRGDAEKNMRASMASEKWKSEAAEKVALFLDELASSPLGKSVFAIQIAYGKNGEWHQWGTDVSEPMKKGFRNYLIEKYGTIEALRKAWNDENVTFDNAEYHPEITRKTDDGMFRDPSKSRIIVDSQRFNQRLVAKDIVYFCEVVKKHLPGVLAGAFYGYYTCVSETQRPISGHLGIDVIYKAHEKGIIDFLCGPFCYTDNRKSDGVPMQRCLLESNRLNGMLWLTEMDQHPVGTAYYVGGDKNAYDETISVMRRNVFQPLLAGEGFWYYDHRLVPRMVPQDSRNPSAGSIYRKHGWWEADELMKEIADLYKFSEERLLRPYKSGADVLMVLDTDSLYHCSNAYNDEYGFFSSLARLGVSFDCIYMYDFDKAELSRYKAVIFANNYMITPERRKKIREKLKGICKVWLYAEGFSDDTTLDVKNISDTVGINIVRSEKKSRVIWDCGTEIAVTDDICDPVFAVNDKGATPIAAYDDGSIAAARKGDDIWCGVPRFTPEIMKLLLEGSGAHVYCEAGDPVLCGYGLVAINCPHGGERTITMPNGKSVTEVLPKWTTAVYDAETGERVF